eukprot:14822962-Ditylum_brightwellii.AAC.1
MDSPIGLGSLVAVQHVATGLWYPALIIAEGADHDGAFYRIVWLARPDGVQSSEAYVDDDHIESLSCEHVLVLQ